MRVLVTGVAGMIGSKLADGLINCGYEVFGVDRFECNNKNIKSYVADIGHIDSVKSIIQDNNIDRVIHLAALAHTTNGDDLSYENYYKVNVECAKNVFLASKDIPVLFISTVDVYGFTKGTVTAQTPLKPVTFYGKTKAIAEGLLKETCKSYNIYRLSPVYTKEIKRDIEKRYYLKKPDIAYLIGKGNQYEILNINKAVKEMCQWCETLPDNTIKIIKDDVNMNTADYIAYEKQCNRAKFVLKIPRWMVVAGYYVIKFIIGENKYTFLLNKAVYPLRTE